jgi:hypothetical protein
MKSKKYKESDKSILLNVFTMLSMVIGNTQKLDDRERQKRFGALQAARGLLNLSLLSLFRSHHGHCHWTCIPMSSISDTKWLSFVELVHFEIRVSHKGLQCVFNDIYLT